MANGRAAASGSSQAELRRAPLVSAQRPRRATRHRHAQGPTPGSRPSISNVGSLDSRATTGATSSTTRSGNARLEQLSSGRCRRRGHLSAPLFSGSYAPDARVDARQVTAFRAGKLMTYRDVIETSALGLAGHLSSIAVGTALRSKSGTDN
jgi:hypothetical protein